MILLEAAKLKFRYSADTQWLLKDFSLLITSGKIITITGASGSGKSTLLYILAGIIPRHRKGELTGEIYSPNIDHKEATLAQISPCISMVMQNPEHQLFFPTVEQELAFAPENLCLSLPEIDNRIADTLELLNICELRHQVTSQLSYGQQKLVALASIHTLQPDILLLDEISNGLSVERQQDVIKLVKGYADSGKAVVMAEHDSLLMELAHKTISLD